MKNSVELYEDFIAKMKCLTNKITVDDIFNKEFVKRVSFMYNKNKCVLKEYYPWVRDNKEFFKDNNIFPLLLFETDCFYCFEYLPSSEWQEITSDVDLMKFKLKMKREGYNFVNVFHNNILKSNITNEMRFIDLKDMEINTMEINNEL